MSPDFEIARNVDEENDRQMNFKRKSKQRKTSVKKLSEIQSSLDDEILKLKVDLSGNATGDPSTTGS